jgi:hypothetical protein
VCCGGYLGGGLYQMEGSIYMDAGVPCLSRYVIYENVLMIRVEMRILITIPSMKIPYTIPTMKIPATIPSDCDLGVL